MTPRHGLHLYFYLLSCTCYSKNNVMFLLSVECRFQRYQGWPGLTKVMVWHLRINDIYCLATHKCQPSKYFLSIWIRVNIDFYLCFLDNIDSSYRHNYLVMCRYLHMYTLATNGAKCYITISLNSGLNDSSVMDFLYFISLVVHVTAKIISSSCSALNADSNDTKVDQDWQKVMMLAHLNRFSNRDQSRGSWR